MGVENHLFGLWNLTRISQNQAAPTHVSTVVFGVVVTDGHFIQGQVQS